MSNNLALQSENLFPPSTYPTTTDLSTKFGYGCKLSSGLAVLATVTGERILGVIRDSTSSTDAHGVSVANTPGQQVTCVAGSTGIAAKGDEVTVYSDGSFLTAVSTNIVIGYADRVAAAGESFICNLVSPYAKA